MTIEDIVKLCKDRSIRWTRHILERLFQRSISMDKEKNMTCFMCKGTTKESISNFTADIDGCIVVIKNVPSSVCSQCGETSYSDEVARQIEKIVMSIKNSASTEVAVVSYSKKAA